MELKVMTFNIRHGRGMDRKVDLKRICKIISDSNADIIGLNEVDKKYSKRSGFVDQLKEMADQLKYDYFFSPSLTISSKKHHILRQYGNGILSRYPIQKAKVHSFSLLKGITEGRSLLETSIKIGNKNINVFVTHLSLFSHLHKMQSTFILNHVKGPAILMGDWNMRPYSKKWENIVRSFRDVWTETSMGNGYTYPSKRPRMRLDYIFVSKEFDIVDTEVITANPVASDHLPLLSTLSI